MRRLPCDGSLRPTARAPGNASPLILRFILICNYVSKIIDPLGSRCSKFRFKPVTTDDGIARLWGICKAEHVKVANHEDTLKFLLENVAEGDLRRAITLLEGIHATERSVNHATICEFGGVIPDNLIDATINQLLLNDKEIVKQEMTKITGPPTHNACSASAAAWLLENVIYQGYSVQQFISQLIPKVFDILKTRF
jgi:DNA polymerase III delta prime subunit